MENTTASLATHRVELVGGQSIKLNCVACHRAIHNTPGYPNRAYADLDGKPWVDYYCYACATDRGADLASGTILELPHKKKGNNQP